MRDKKPIPQWLVETVAAVVIGLVISSPLFVEMLKTMFHAWAQALATLP